MNPDTMCDEDEAFLALAVRLAFLDAPISQSLLATLITSRDADTTPVSARDLAARLGHLTAAQIDIIEMLRHPTQSIPGYE